MTEWVDDMSEVATKSDVKIVEWQVVVLREQIVSISVADEYNGCDLYCVVRGNSQGVSLDLSEGYVCQNHDY
ncbi:MAG: hypothetical protein A3J38_07255 [Gammaproteobacteria bacterium RIFCSPHIGHO2_12_FULL_45_9]|nr:MAG: hypothetical protein A3J38_07255 [Gammaproteobacteria bacterium RIFCSPHIGHO2_12_FULL_45_9]